MDSNQIIYILRISGEYDSISFEVKSSEQELEKIVEDIRELIENKNLMLNIYKKERKNSLNFNKEINKVLEYTKDKDNIKPII